MSRRRSDETEGVVRFRADHRAGPLPPAAAALLPALLGWRRVLRALGVVGRDPGRYGGYGFGNVSRRAPAAAASPPPGRRPFVVSGTQTAHLPDPGADAFALVEAYDPVAARVTSRGPVVPSSESLTHAALYDADPGVGAVFHAHAPELWRAADELALPTTPPAAAAGTAEMAAAVAELWRRAGRPAVGVFVLAGHEDGVLAFGPDPRAAGERLVAALAAAWGTKRPPG